MRPHHFLNVHGYASWNWKAPQQAQVPVGTLATGGRFLLLARAGENSSQRVVAFMAGVFVDRIVRAMERQLASEGPRERLRILDREAVVDPVRRDPREALDHACVA